MRILALETSSTQGSVALWDQTLLIGQAELPAQPRVAQTLVPAIGDLLERAGWRVAELDLVAVTRGPGSFTGLRVGVTAAKTLAYAAKRDVLGLDTLEVIGQQALGGLPGEGSDYPPAGTGSGHFPRRIHAVLDAQRGDLFHASYQPSEAGDLVPATATRIVAAQQWLRELRPGDLVCGTGLRLVQDDLPAGIQVGERPLWAPQAAVVAWLARRDYLAGRRDDLWRLVPDYHRPSAAEEKASRRSAD